MGHSSITNSQFINYFFSVQNPFAECINAMDKYKDAFDQGLAEVQKIEQKKHEINEHNARMKMQVSAQVPQFWQHIDSQTFSGTNALSRQGFLWKKSSRFATWKRRIVLVSHGVLSYGKSLDEVTQKPHNIELLLCSVKPELNSQRLHCFSISSSKTTHLFQAFSEWDLQKWLAIIQNNIAAEIETGDHNTSSLQHPITKNFINEDSICADCKCKGAKWVSLNLAVHLCADCSAEHRGMGAGISSIRSSTLDDLGDIESATIEAIDSLRANSVMEAKLSDYPQYKAFYSQDTPVLSPSPHSSRKRKKSVRVKSDQQIKKQEPKEETKEENVKEKTKEKIKEEKTKEENAKEKTKEENAKEKTKEENVKSKK